MLNDCRKYAERGPDLVAGVVLLDAVARERERQSGVKVEITNGEVQIHEKP